MTNLTLPEYAVEAAARKAYENMNPVRETDWLSLPTRVKKIWIEDSRSQILAYHQALIERGDAYVRPNRYNPALVITLEKP